MPKAFRAFSSVGRASPLQGEGQKFESSNAHHKRDDDICYHLFYFECFDSENLLLKFERGASRVRSVFTKRMKFFEVKHVDTFNASDSRQSHQAPHLKKHSQECFLCADEDEKPFEGSSEERAECGVLLQRVGNSEAKHVDTFNANEQDNPIRRPIFRTLSMRGF